MLPKTDVVRRSRSGQVPKREKAKSTHVNVVEFSPAFFREQALTDLKLLDDVKQSDYFKWIDVQGMADQEVIKRVAEVFDIHPLALEDVVNARQRPKTEAYEKHIFFIVHLIMMIRPGDVSDVQVSVLIGRNYVITFQDRFGEVLDPLRQRLRQGAGRFRNSGADYLAYAIIDAIIDHCFPVLEELGDYFQRVEDRVALHPTPAVFSEVHQLRRELLRLRRTVWPQREALNSLIRDENSFVTESVRVYLRDCYDHCVQIIDVTETYRELVTGLVDLYHSSLSNRLNEVMKVLTVISTIFMPLSFIAGVYGMNFEHMPELKLYWAYPALLLAMLFIGVGMLFFFYLKGWIGSSRSKRRAGEHLID